jgi:hypothetical protein
MFGILLIKFFFNFFNFTDYLTYLVFSFYRIIYLKINYLYLIWNNFHLIILSYGHLLLMKVHFHLIHLTCKILNILFKFNIILKILYDLHFKFIFYFIKN